MMQEIVKLAEKIARESHKGQKRWDGKPYIAHPESVAKLFIDNSDCQIVAWLHDVIEDTKLTYKDLEEEGVPRRITQILDYITKDKKESYKDYILNLKDCEVARLVKIEDLKHNLLTIKPGSMKDKYLLALHILGERSYGK